MIDVKKHALEQHESQQNRLASTQKMNSYVQSMLENSTVVGQMAQPQVQYGERWRQHLHLGFGAKDFAPLQDTLDDKAIRV